MKDIHCLRFLTQKMPFNVPGITKNVKNKLDTCRIVQKLYFRTISFESIFKEDIEIKNQYKVEI